MFYFQAAKKKIITAAYDGGGLSRAASCHSISLSKGLSLP